MEKNPASEKIDCSLRDEKDQLRHQNQGYKSNIPIVDTHIDHRLCKQRENQLKKASQQQPKEQLPKEFLLVPEIGKEVREGGFVCFLLLLHVKIRGRFNDQCQPFGLQLIGRATPSLQKITGKVIDQAKGWVSHPDFTLAKSINHHKMFLFPVNNGG